ncbi:hypothetical protein [Pseudomonas fluorescens]|uniref:Uncharacterized protein n=1 Tax=Pseudomonas fluorescens TaxID=294 RepID=A0A5E7EZ68_PSEFL|nr:hypothetical protein [Pseudomonas fluorescens]VVO32245.1 hypothetical protein PS691_05036 [Pseudomonas fluorescens]
MSQDKPLSKTPMADLIRDHAHCLPPEKWRRCKWIFWAPTRYVRNVYRALTKPTLH